MDFTEEYKQLKGIIWNKTRKLHHRLASYEDFYKDKNTSLIFGVLPVIEEYTGLDIPLEKRNNAKLSLNWLIIEISKFPDEEEIKWEII